MSKRRFLPEQIQELLSNSNVTKCSEKAISYNKDFKIEAVRQFKEEGKTANQIFRAAGFNLNTIGEHTPEYRLKDWRRIYKIKGEIGLRKESRGRGGGRPKTKGLTDADRIKRMEAEIAYLKAENSFLAKLRAKRAESNSGPAKNTILFEI